MVAELLAARGCGLFYVLVDAGAALWVAGRRITIRLRAAPAERESLASGYAGGLRSRFIHKLSSEAIAYVRNHRNRSGREREPVLI